MHARWPEVGVVDLTLLKEADYLTTVSHEFRVRLKKMVEMREKVKTTNIIPFNFFLYMYFSMISPSSLNPLVHLLYMAMLRCVGYNVTCPCRYCSCIFYYFYYY